ncbi:fimbrial protein [Serratia fonticola]|uniref:fimbrial protein n=1 Tax=Serratia fonticola TaxID=47917 RepID=UPI00192A81B0|nr:fimbrial protein [Serratia fonticola]MBL5904114.1 type 1 fimbrial protein [Serratia fonticola]
MHDTKVNIVLYFAIIGLGLAICFMSFAADVPVNFHGTISSSACSINNTETSQTVALGTVSATSLAQAGALSPAKTFNIVIQCPSGGPSQATVTFTGTADNKDSTLLAIDPGTGTASGVAINIADHLNTKINFGTPSATQSLVAGSNTLTFVARYQSTVPRSEITPGVANGTAQFTLNYP